MKKSMSLDACEEPNDIAADEVCEMPRQKSAAISQSSNDPAGLFLNNSVSNLPLKSHIPAVDTHRSDADVWNLNQLHKANNCSNCGQFVAAKCKVHGYSMPYTPIDCMQWEYRGKKA